MQYRDLQPGDCFIFPEHVHKPYETEHVRIFQKLKDRKIFNSNFSLARTKPESFLSQNTIVIKIIKP